MRTIPSAPCGVGPASRNVGRSTLRVLVGLNGGMCAFELVAGWRAQSMGLIADGLDMGADASVYLLALLAVGASAERKLRAARFAGRAQLVLAMLTIIEVGRRWFRGSNPESSLMIVVSLIALVVNLACLALLRPHRDGDVHLQSAWIFSSTDVQANLSVMAAGYLVSALDSPVPDLVIGLLVCGLVFRGALRIRQRIHESDPR